MTGPSFLRVPYHIDEYLPDLDLPLPVGRLIDAHAYRAATSSAYLSRT